MPEIINLVSVLCHSQSLSFVQCHLEIKCCSYLADPSSRAPSYFAGTLGSGVRIVLAELKIFDVLLRLCVMVKAFLLADLSSKVS